MSIAHETALLAPFEIWEVMLDDTTIKFFEPLLLKPKRLAGDDDLWIIEKSDLGLSAFGTDRESLWECVQSCIRMAWKEFVCEDDRNLLPLAKKYKDAYLSIAEDVDE